jgi:hypothetical protein
MKKVLMLTLCLTLCAGAAMADHIGLYADPAGTACFAPWAGFAQVYAVHKLNPGSTASQFKVDDTSLAPKGAVSYGTYLNIGNVYTGVSLAYLACIQGDHVVATLTYFGAGAPTTCGAMHVVQDPTAVPPVLQVVDCPGFAKPATGGSFYFGTAACGDCHEPSATSTATWGSIKALYR